MTQDERWDLYDKLSVLDMKIWPNDDEREDFGKTYFEWSEILGHPPRIGTDGKPRGCTTCGWGASCVLDVFFEGVIETTMKRLEELHVLDVQ